MKGQSQRISTLISIGLTALHCCLGFDIAPLSTSPQYMQCPRRFASATTLMQTSPPSSGSECGGRTVRILCLHGKGGNGDSFVSRALAPLRGLLDSRLEEMDADRKFSVEWDALTAPFEITSSKSTSEDNRGYSWWSMPAGVRSFNAEEYEGFSQSEEVVMNAIYSEEKCNYDIVLGHSQGSILTAALLSIHSKLLGSAAPKGFIFNGVAWPNPYSYNMQALSTLSRREQSNEARSPRMLFIMGKADDINPIESAKQVSGSFDRAGFDTSIIEHDGGHSVPYGCNQDSQHALERVVEWILDTAEES